MPSQAQKHVTHNEALQRLDILVQLAVEEFDSNTPPELPNAGEIYAIGSNPNADWAGHAGEIRAWIEDGWEFITPMIGWLALDKSSGTVRRLTAEGWVDIAPPDINLVPGIGINTNYDTVNRLAIAASASLFDHEGAGHRVMVNKSASTETASLIFQTASSGHAEIGTAGTDDLSVKVSTDGGSWTEALRFSADTGMVSGEAVTPDALSGSAGQLLKVGDYGLGTDAGVHIADLDTHQASGFYAFYGGQHPNSTVGDNPFPSFGGAGGLLCGNRENGDPDGFMWQFAMKYHATEPEPQLRCRASSTLAWGPWYKFRTTLRIPG